MFTTKTLKIFGPRTWRTKKNILLSSRAPRIPFNVLSRTKELKQTFDKVNVDVTGVLVVDEGEVHVLLPQAEGFFHRVFRLTN